MHKKILKPNFLIIGAPKSGTTSLYNYLQQHPDIEFSDIKEPKYFSFKDINFDFISNEKALSQIKKSTVTNLEDYLKLFTNKNAKWIGEASPNYFHFEPAAKNIYDFNVEMKLILILRNPIDRLYSDWKHNVRMGFETELNFKKAIKLIDERVKTNMLPYHDYLIKGKYAQHLERYFKYFARENIKVVFYDDFKKKPSSTCNEILHFLGIERNFNFNTEIIHMKSSPIIRYPKLKKQIKSLQLISYRVYQFFEKINTIPEKMSNSNRKFAINYYRDDILKLEKLLQRELNCWYKKP